MANPVTSLLGPDKDQVLVYYVTENKTLGLDQYPLSDSTTTPIEFDSHGAPSGIVVQSQCISAVYQRGLPIVYGQVEVTNPKDTTKTVNVVAQLSPVTSLLAAGNAFPNIITDKPSLAAASDGQGVTWVYYLQQFGKTSPVLWEVKVSSGGKPVFNTWQKPKLLPTSRLAAIYALNAATNQKDRIVFWQAADNSIQWLAGTSSGDPSTINGTTDALPGTPLAVVQAEDGRDMHLYYIGATKEVKRATRQAEGSWKVTTASMPQTPPFATARDGTQLCVTQSIRNTLRTNHVFYISETSVGYEEHTDGSSL